MADQLLLYSVAQGDVHQVSTLIAEANADVNYQNSVGTTACHVIFLIIHIILSRR